MSVCNRTEIGDLSFDLFNIHNHGLLPFVGGLNSACHVSLHRAHSFPCEHAACSVGDFNSAFRDDNAVDVVSATAVEEQCMNTHCPVFC